MPSGARRRRLKSPHGLRSVPPQRNGDLFHVRHPEGQAHRPQDPLADLDLVYVLGLRAVYHLDGRCPAAKFAPLP